MLAAMLSAQPHAGLADPLALQRGAYQITIRLELPHLERWASEHTLKGCLPQSGAPIPIPVLSANNPFGKCAAAKFAIEGTNLQYDIICPGRGAAKAHAVYMIAPDKFTGRVSMVMGGKNMTMTEVQRGHRVGDCDTASPQSARRF